jgi:hypothetical protein
MQIHEYSYKPFPPLFARAASDLACTEPGSLFLGVELETWYPRPSGRPRLADALDSIPFPMIRTTEAPTALFYPKNDSSLQADDGLPGSGVELVSYPFAYGLYMTRLRDELTATLTALSAAGFLANKSTGMHIHVSRKAFVNTPHLTNFLNLFYRYPSFTYRLSGRANNSLVDQWAKLDVRGEETLLEKAERESDSDRRTAVNMTPHTAEIRIFAATLSPEHFHARLQVAFAAVRYSEVCNKLAHAVPVRFRLWVREHATEYPELAGLFTAGWSELDNDWLRKNPTAFPALFDTL